MISAKFISRISKSLHQGVDLPIYLSFTCSVLIEQTELLFDIPEAFCFLVNNDVFDLGYAFNKCVYLNATYRRVPTRLLFLYI